VTIVYAMKNLIITLDRARQLLFGIGMESKKQLSRRISSGIIRNGSQLYLRSIKRNEDSGKITNQSAKIQKRIERFLK
jgi:hypothetical protein